jgi:hypothetical protein
MQHLTAFYESVDQGGALAAIAAVPDQSLNISGDDVTVPGELPFLAGAACLTAAATLTAAQIQAPSLQALAYPDIDTLVGAVVFGSIPEYSYNPSTARRLVGGEDLQFHTNTDNVGATGIYGLITLIDGPPTPVGGDQFTVRCTGAATLSAGLWVNTNLTFTQNLPFGNYDVVGIRAVGTNLVAARLNFIGGSFRPGVPAVNANGDVGFAPMRHGRSGILGSFNSKALPTLDCLGVTDTAQTIFLDLIRTS